jgi:hypothetical protein
VRLQKESYSMTVVLDRRRPAESNITRWTRIADRVLRGTCQQLDCEEPCQVSDDHTSLAFCSEHYREFQMNTCDGCGGSGLVPANSGSDFADRRCQECDGKGRK